MALITCKDCGKQFSDAAAACPNCGRPHRSIPPATVKIERKTGCATWGCLGLIVFGVLSALIASDHKGPAGPPVSASEAQQAKADAAKENAAGAASSRDYSDYALQNVAEKTIRASLRDPESAVFESRVVRKGARSTVCGTVNAKNGFGGFTGATRFLADTQVVMVKDDDNAALFSKRWNARCAGS